MKPIVALVGRTNVGKSTLFNRMCRRRYAIMDDEPGVTRDRLYADVEIDDRVVTLIDTGGLADAPAEWLAEDVAGQAIHAMSEADVIIMTTMGTSQACCMKERTFRAPDSWVGTTQPGMSAAKAAAAGEVLK